MHKLLNLKMTIILGVLLSSLVSTPLIAEELPQYEVGLRFDGNLSNGSPANDILGYSATVHYRLTRDWLLGFALESARFDFERPYSEFDYQSINPATGSEEVIDSIANSLMASVWFERRYDEPAIGGYWFWTAGGGINDVDVDEIAGTRTGNVAFKLKADVDTELVATVTAGRRHNVTSSWTLGYGIRLEQRFGDWTLTDTTTGEKTIAVDGYSVHGMFLSTSFRF